MPASKPIISSAAVKPALVQKKNTVDYIPSKLSYDTAMPVTILDDRSEFIERFKPYDIIDGPNPLGDVPEAEHHNAEVVSLASVDTGKSRRSPPHSSRKRSRSPLKGAAKNSLVKEESDGDSGAAAAPPSLPVFTRPSRSGFAAEWLREGRPYQLLRSCDMETRVRYVLDDCDYEWCAIQNLSPEVVQRGITYLEWAYASSLLMAATPHIDDPVIEATPPLTSSGDTADDSSGQQQKSVSAFSDVGNGARSDACGDDVSSPTTNAIARLNRARRQIEQAKQPGADASAFTCALCSKNVHLLSEEAPFGAAERNDASVATERDGGRGHKARSGKAAAAAGSRRTSHSAASTVRRATWRGQRSNSVGCFPSKDVLHQGLRCCKCGVVAHLRCWFLTEPPRMPEAWMCDGCTSYAQHRKRSAGVCCMCGRMGGVVLPYVGSAAAMKDDGTGGSNNGGLQPAAQSNARGNVGAAPATLSDMVCHAVCAMAMPELAVHHKRTIVRRNGVAKTEERPYVCALRRVGKHKYAMRCVFCEHGGTGRCVQCHHPHCFEAMHASCAAEAHTVDCHTDVSSSPTSLSPSAGDVRGAAMEARVQPRSAEASSLNNCGGTGGTLSSSELWASCSTYCKKHYGYSVSNSVGSAVLGDKAEAEALALDLTGLLTGGQGVTSPVVRKRGRGRPPVALVQQREAERDLVQKLRIYWLERREQRRRSSGQLVSEINARLRNVVEATLRPEIVKVSADKVRLSHSLSLVPEWQWQLVAVVEGELPLPDEEYDDVQKYRKVAHTRRSGNTRSLYDRMSVAATQLDLTCRLATAVKHECRVRRTSAELELESLRLLCKWK
ncbi:hypothetical protein ABL78_1898 [Leptomonas seymouri]|uniref:PHD-type domain-containing protein n=1 Tax=Leptomonas seymouri TaxID=5684 RepID=A0A0N1IA05_LEPSE|nr:hypothetical protein ABL78_1898 [Leptomonas seymouri]|eukprot:KPI89014.1 hypothetical protein ABL78_1898 [Leptomonas seymouri]